MSEKTVVVQRGGIGFLPLLFLVFLVLKLTGVITWSWWWVTAPLWVPVVIVGGVFVIAFAAYMIVAMCNAIIDADRKKGE